MPLSPWPESEPRHIQIPEELYLNPGCPTFVVIAAEHWHLGNSMGVVVVGAESSLKNSTSYKTLLSTTRPPVLRQTVPSSARCSLNPQAWILSGPISAVMALTAGVTAAARAVAWAAALGLSADLWEAGRGIWSQGVGLERFGG